MRKVLVGLSLVAVLSLTACGNNATNNKTDEGNAGQEAVEPVDYTAQLNEIHTAVKDAYGDNYIPSMEIDAATLESVYGITSDMYDVVIAEGPMMSTHVDTFIAIHPTEGNEQAVVDALTAYRDTQLNDALQYPMNLMKIEASEVKQLGDYVFYIMLGMTDEMYDDEASELAAYQDLNKIAVDAINGVLNK